MKYDNYTKYGIHNESERQVLTAYSSILVLSSLIGDSLILIGSLRYNAIKLHKVMAVFIQYIAAADLLVSIFRILPGAVSLAADGDIGNILGNSLCSLGYVATYSFGGAANLLISALALAKLLIVKFPFRALHFPRKYAHLVSFAILVCSMSFPTMALIKDKNGVYFSFLVYNCDYSCSELVWTSFEYAAFCITIGVIGIIASATTIVSSVMLLILARRITERDPGGLQWPGIMVVLLTATFYCLTVLPCAVYYMCDKFVSEQTSGAFHVYFYRYVCYVVLLNTVSNFYIYILTLSSFREFLKSRIRVVSGMLVRWSVPNDDQLGTHRTERQRLLSRVK